METMFKKLWVFYFTQRCTEKGAKLSVKSGDCVKDLPNRAITRTKITGQQLQWVKQLKCENHLKPKVLKRLTGSLKKVL